MPYSESFDYENACASEIFLLTNQCRSCPGITMQGPFTMPLSSRESVPQMLGVKEVDYSYRRGHIIDFVQTENEVKVSVTSFLLTVYVHVSLK